jgi:hypothetical protein
MAFTILYVFAKWLLLIQLDRSNKWNKEGVVLPFHRYLFVYNRFRLKFRTRNNRSLDRKTAPTTVGTTTRVEVLFRIRSRGHSTIL